MRHRGDILIVDDEDVVLQGARKILTAEGLTVDVAPSADAAISRMRDEGYRLVLSDLLLPGMDGIDLMLALRRRHCRTPVVIVTGFATLDRAIESFRNGAFDFLPKPFDAEELIGIVRRALGYFDLTGTGWSEPAESKSKPPDEVYGFGRHSVVELEPNGKAWVRLGATFADLGEDLASITLPRGGDDIRQGNECARITAQDKSVHRVWAPLSGQVSDPAPATDYGPRNLHGKRLFVMQPTELQSELGNLTHHRPMSRLDKDTSKEPTW